MGDIDNIIAVLALAALMFSPMIAIVVLPTAEKANEKRRRDRITNG